MGMSLSAGIKPKKYYHNDHILSMYFRPFIRKTL